MNLPASGLWERERHRVYLQLTVYDVDKGRHQVCLFCEDKNKLAHIEFTRTHRLDIPLHRYEGNPVAATIIGSGWEPMNITLDEQKPNTAVGTPHECYNESLAVMPAEHPPADNGAIPFKDCRLVDDGSLDTVVEIWCKQHNTWHEVRYISEYAEPFRNADGGLDFPAFWREHIKDDDALLCEEE